MVLITKGNLLPNHLLKIFPKTKIQISKLQSRIRETKFAMHTKEILNKSHQIGELAIGIHLL